ncbi:MAG: hypothetical protein Q7O66_03730 [Dehalococcoidia bacterium]|nr:hypothetical protein [Dehalococcoidia bacterium]
MAITGKTETFAWVGAIVLTFVAAGIAVEVAKWFVLLLHGVVYWLPYRMTSGLTHVALYGVILVAPASVAWTSWKWLLLHKDRTTVVTAILACLAIWFVAWPTLLAYQIGYELGR